MASLSLESKMDYFFSAGFAQQALPSFFSAAALQHAFPSLAQALASLGHSVFASDFLVTGA